MSKICRKFCLQEIFGLNRACHTEALIHLRVHQLNDSGRNYKHESGKEDCKQTSSFAANSTMIISCWSFANTFSCSLSFWRCSSWYHSLTSTADMASYNEKPSVLIIGFLWSNSLAASLHSWVISDHMLQQATKELKTFAERVDSNDSTLPYDSSELRLQIVGNSTPDDFNNVMQMFWEYGVWSLLLEL